MDKCRVLDSPAVDLWRVAFGLELMASRWSVGSVLFLASFAAVMGPLNYMYHLFSAPRLPFTAAYFGSILTTLLFALKVRFQLRRYRNDVTDPPARSFTAPF